MAVNGETEATDNEADEWETEQVGNEYTDGQVEMKMAAEDVIKPGA